MGPGLPSPQKSVRARSYSFSIRYRPLPPKVARGTGVAVGLDDSPKIDMGNHRDHGRPWLKRSALTVAFVLLCVPALTRVTERAAQRQGNTKHTLSFRRVAEEAPQKIHFENAAVQIGARTVGPDRLEGQHLADSVWAAPSVSRVSPSPRGPPAFSPAV
jgi:hypothetical protein